MRRSIAPLIAIAIGLCLIRPVLAQKPEAPPAYLEHFNDGHTTLFVINDPLPTIQRTLTSESLRRVLLEGKFAKLMKRDLKTANLDPREWWQVVDENRRWVPREIVFGTSNDGVGSFDRLIRMMELMALNMGAVAAEVEGDEAIAANEKDAAELAKLMAAELKALKAPHMRLWFRTRDPEDAGQLFQLASAQLAANADGETVIVNAGENELRVEVKFPGVEDEDVAMVVLTEMGIVGDAESPGAKELAIHLKNLRLAATLRPIGDGLLLTVGDVPQGKPLDLTKLGPTFRGEPEDLLWSRWDVVPLKKAVNGWWELWQAWAEKPAGQTAVQWDESDLVGTLKSFNLDIAKLADRGTMRLWSGDDGAHAIVREEDAPTVKPLAESDVLRFVPASAEGFDIDAANDLGALLAGTLLQFEDRLESKRFTADIGDNEKQIETYENLAESYYSDLDAFRQLAIHKSREVFVAPAVTLIGSKGKIAKFEMQLKDAGKPEVFTGSDMPMMELAVIGVARDAKTADVFIRDTYAAFAEGLLKALDREPLKLKDGGVQAADLGLGVSTFELAGNWIGRASGEAELSMTFDGDLRPHYFFDGNVLVFSTSPRLSREILAARNDASKRLKLPAPTGEGTLTAYGRFPGETLAGYVEHLSIWADLFLKHAPAEEAAAIRPIAGAVEILGAFGEFARIIDVFEWTSIDSAGGVQTTDAHMRVR